MNYVDQLKKFINLLEVSQVVHIYTLLGDELLYYSDI